MLSHQASVLAKIKMAINPEIPGMENDEKGIAERLFLIVSGIYQKLDILGDAARNKEVNQLAAGYQASLIELITAEIKNAINLEDAAKKTTQPLIEKWIKIFNECIENGDVYSAVAIRSALYTLEYDAKRKKDKEEKDPIAKLAIVFDNLPEDLKQIKVKLDVVTRVEGQDDQYEWNALKYNKIDAIKEKFSSRLVLPFNMFSAWLELSKENQNMAGAQGVEQEVDIEKQRKVEEWLKKITVDGVSDLREELGAAKKDRAKVKIIIEFILKHPSINDEEKSKLRELAKLYCDKASLIGIKALEETQPEVDKKRELIRKEKNDAIKQAEKEVNDLVPRAAKKKIASFEEFLNGMRQKKTYSAKANFVKGYLERNNNLDKKIKESLLKLYQVYSEKSVQEFLQADGVGRQVAIANSFLIELYQKNQQQYPMIDIYIKKMEEDYKGKDMPDELKEKIEEIKRIRGSDYNPKDENKSLMLAKMKAFSDEFDKEFDRYQDKKKGSEQVPSIAPLVVPPAPSAAEGDKVEAKKVEAQGLARPVASPPLPSSAPLPAASKAESVPVQVDEKGVIESELSIKEKVNQRLKWKNAVPAERVDQDNPSLVLGLKRIDEVQDESIDIDDLELLDALSKDLQDLYKTSDSQDGLTKEEMEEAEKEELDELKQWDDLAEAMVVLDAGFPNDEDSASTSESEEIKSDIESIEEKEIDIQPKRGFVLPIPTDQQDEIFKKEQAQAQAAIMQKVGDIEEKKAEEKRLEMEKLLAEERKKVEVFYEKNREYIDKYDQSLLKMQCVILIAKFTAFGGNKESGIEFSPQDISNTLKAILEDKELVKGESKREKESRKQRISDAIKYFLYYKHIIDKKFSAFESSKKKISESEEKYRSIANILEFCLKKFQNDRHSLGDLLNQFEEMIGFDKLTEEERKNVKREVDEIPRLIKESKGGTKNKNETFEEYFNLLRSALNKVSVSDEVLFTEMTPVAPKKNIEKGKSPELTKVTKDHEFTSEEKEMFMGDIRRLDDRFSLKIFKEGVLDQESYAELLDKLKAKHGVGGYGKKFLDKKYADFSKLPEDVKNEIEKIIEENIQSIKLKEPEKKAGNWLDDAFPVKSAEVPKAEAKKTDALMEEISEDEEEEKKPKIFDQPPPLSPPPSLVRVEEGILEKLRDKLKEWEGKKLPCPPFTYDNTDPTKIKITYNGEELSSKQVEKMNFYSSVVRKLSIMAGVAYSLEYDGFMPKDKKGAVINVLKKLMDKVVEKADKESVAKPAKDPGFSPAKLLAKLFAKSDDIDPAEDMNKFIENMSDMLVEASGEEKSAVIRKMRLAERYFTATYRHDVQHEFALKRLDGKVVKFEDHLFGNQLTEEQKREIIKIHDSEEKQPDWFKCLLPWEKEWFIKQVPKDLGDVEQWEKFEKIFQSSAMQQMPGIKNARMNYLRWGDEEISRSFKASTFVPYEMPVGSKEKEAERTAKQVIEYLREEVEKRSEFKRWKKLLGDQFKPLIYIQTLFSDVPDIVPFSDIKLAEQQKKAVIEAAVGSKDIIIGHDPLNVLRHIASARWEHTDKLIKHADEFLSAIHLKRLADPNCVDKAAIDEINFIKAVNAELKRMKDSVGPTPGRNFNAYKAALTELLVEAMGGMVSTNCKSGKDRTGMDELYRAAILIYYKENDGRLPRFDDSGTKRDDFVELFVKLFNCMKVQESAAANTPGSLGLKDSGSKVLCSDIADKLGESYGASNKRANINKPKLFEEDEKKRQEEIEVWAKAEEKHKKEEQRKEETPQPKAPEPKAAPKGADKKPPIVLPDPDDEDSSEEKKLVKGKKPLENLESPKPKEPKLSGFHDSLFHHDSPYDPPVLKSSMPADKDEEVLRQAIEECTKAVRSLSATIASYNTMFSIYRDSGFTQFRKERREAERAGAGPVPRKGGAPSI